MFGGKYGCLVSCISGERENELVFSIFVGLEARASNGLLWGLVTSW
jgi:hypothetical protein